MKPHDTWEVLPHGDLEKLADNLYIVEGKLPMPLGDSIRHMTIVRLAGNRLAIFSAIALDEARMAKLEALGTPAFLIVPSGIHRIDAKPWRDRYPQLQVIAPEHACARISHVVDVDTTDADLGDPNAELFYVPGTDRRELAMIVHTSTGKTLVLNDLIFNMPAIDGWRGWPFKLMGFGFGHPSMPKLVMRKLVANDNDVRDQLRRWAHEGFERIIVSHGKPIENPREALLELAAA
ncbi:MAG TPA: hypothetical protein VL326_04550 [Kofleriaceae bacterium]|jgi:hypothetical protein|nr:hypothetical protein [Kofleriaceae bacterium]